MSKYSSGPWINKGYGAIVGGPEIQFARGKGRRQVACAVSVGDVDDGEWEANSALISAAPELLESLDPDALDAIADELTEFRHSARADSLRVIARKQRVAIAKATGAKS